MIIDIKILTTVCYVHTYLMTSACMKNSITAPYVELCKQRKHYSDLPEQNITYPCCNSGHIEDEHHFLFKCSSY
jgi:hypothetical protein